MLSTSLSPAVHEAQTPPPQRPQKTTEQKRVAMVKPRDYEEAFAFTLFGSAATFPGGGRFVPTGFKDLQTKSLKDTATRSRAE
ncbi:hypothetical protein CFIMG_007596RA00001 [Ceratocystis fimbriata CBS 114723]|uniref:Uncharacterized protein n=1 Tax=Ceratocystis fimbriata CBS 114723 TaxID=1035309 RepID=A0A2C5WW64_9PEZI|nr:hypothetical protein CFIMG_007596RA00001 [Ceratocystis fimbriata CBS 114723]